MIGLGMLALAGCGGGAKSFAPPAVETVKMGQTVVWIDGDPRVPFCNGGMKNCQDHYTIHDKTTGAVSTLPITKTLFTPPTTDLYEIRAEGYDNDGLPISSAFQTIPQ
jgi:hypothetical protein